MEKIGCRIAQRLTSALTGKGIDYDILKKLVYDELMDITTKHINGDWIEFPNGDTYEKTFTVSK